MNLIETTADVKAYCIEGIQGILRFWCTQMYDRQQGGFYGSMSHTGKVNHKASKGAVLNYRILWSLSAAAKLPQLEWCKPYAKDVYDYTNSNFWDSAFGGVFWSLDYKGNKFDAKKQIYAQAFAIYGYCAYYNLTGDAGSLVRAKELFEFIEKYSYDAGCSGYFEAFGEHWQIIDDLRLSEKDANEKKTMNTHLHLLEAYTALYLLWPDKVLGERIKSLIIIFNDYIIDKDTGHLGLFFDEHWNRRDSLVSFGHDIEASWLLLEAAEAINDSFLVDLVKGSLQQMVDASMRGLDLDGALWYEWDFEAKHMVYEKHWWPQAEALVGFCNAWKCTGDRKYYDALINCLRFIQLHLVDDHFKEWKWGVLRDYTTMSNQDLAGFWKCPYHNTRAFLELLKRL